MAENISSASGIREVVEVVLTPDERDAQHRRLARIKRAIRRQTRGGVHQLALEMQAGALVLRGHCASFYCKQLAQHAAMRSVSGGTIVNEIKVDVLPR